MCVAFFGVCETVHLPGPLLPWGRAHTLFLSFNFLPEMQLILWNTTKLHSEVCFPQWALQNRFDFYMHTFTTSNSCLSSCGSGCTSKLLHARAVAWKVEAFPPNRHVLCISVAASTIWLKYPLYSIPLYFLSIWHSYEESAPNPHPLALPLSPLPTPVWKKKKKAPKAEKLRIFWWWRQNCWYFF